MTPTHRNVMVAVDFGEASRRAFDAAVDLAARLEVDLDVVHVAPPPPSELSTTPAYVEAANELLAGYTKAAELRGVSARTHLRMDAVAFALLEVIDALQPFVVVVGSHGRGGVTRALLGSISDLLARRSPVPVLIVPSPNRRQVARATAYACSDCGHILAAGESTYTCAQCGKAPATWQSAPIDREHPADVDAPHVGEPLGGEALEALEARSHREPSALFSTEPPGSSGTSVNPELRVRY
jgi:nucleotide-binding universal stress UspA family protein